jgi:hypothetical protein
MYAIWRIEELAGSLGNPGVKVGSVKRGLAVKKS